MYLELYPVCMGKSTTYNKYLLLHQLAHALAPQRTHTLLCSSRISVRGVKVWCGDACSLSEPPESSSDVNGELRDGKSKSESLDCTSPPRSMRLWRREPPALERRRIPPALERRRSPPPALKRRVSADGDGPTDVGVDPVAAAAAASVSSAAATASLARCSRSRSRRRRLRFWRFAPLDARL